ncbi:MAG TPA: hypothetical protein VFM88_05715 [Vicinamibacteria bacterium]|nr:hypothetical protein [Vicinamibacteria bacterium]
MTSPVDDPGRRRPWKEGPAAVEGGWLSLSDDELLYRIECLGEDHDQDESLLQVIDSDRHFFVRQEAAKKIRDVHLLKEHSGDRHIGQILVRGMTRNEDVDYLRKLLAESRHLEVRKAAEVQLRLLTRDRG